MSPLAILALADDLTGALEVGAKFAPRGIAALVTTELRLHPTGMDEATQVLVIDTETRHLAPAGAAATVHRLAAAARVEGIPFVYKKTDSTLRGNIGSELAAVLGAYPGSRLVYVPAYPRMGRTVKQGHLYVNGVPVNETAFARDHLNPIVESYIPHVLAAQCNAPVHALNTMTMPGICLCDGETDADVVAAARLLMESGAPVLAAGPAALPEQIAALLAGPHPGSPVWPTLKNCLVINGSLHEHSARQVSHAQAEGWPVVEPALVRAAVAAHHWVILRPAARPGETVRDILEEVSLDAVVVFGGDTAYAIIDAVGRPPIHPVGEVIPGVPLSRTAGDLYLVTKAGGFGPPDILCALRNLLSPCQ